MSIDKVKSRTGVHLKWVIQNKPIDKTTLTSEPPQFFSFFPSRFQLNRVAENQDQGETSHHYQTSLQQKPSLEVCCTVSRKSNIKLWKINMMLTCCLVPSLLVNNSVHSTNIKTCLPEPLMWQEADAWKNDCFQLYIIFNLLHNLMLLLLLMNCTV